MHVLGPWQEDRMHFTIHMNSPIPESLPPWVVLFALVWSDLSLSLVGLPMSPSVPQIGIN